MDKATPVITLSATSGEIIEDYTETFMATVSSGSVATAAGTLSAVSNTSHATVSPISTSMTANISGVATTETITGVEAGVGTITVSFAPTDTTNFNNAVEKTYTITVRPSNYCISGDYLNDCLIYNDYGSRNYSEAIANINSKEPSNFYYTSEVDEGLKAYSDYSSISSTTLDGTTYYYRGAVPDNWVSFAGYLWRVVRINGDGSIRLIYSGTTSNHTGAGTQIGRSIYNQSAPEDFGYTYGNNIDSTIKTYIDSWYENNLKNGYENYLSNEIFCNDRSIYYTSGSTVYYGVEGRFTYTTDTYSPSLECLRQADRYTLKESGKSSLVGVDGVGNNLLDYPISLLSTDEAALSGASSSCGGTGFYLSTGQNYWLTTTHAYTGYSYMDNMIYRVVNDDMPFADYYSYIWDGYIINNLGVRPVINLKASVKYDSGKGTENSPYVIVQEPSIILSTVKGSVAPSDTTTFTATIYSGDATSIPGTLTVSSSDTSKATVSPTSSSVTATPSGTSVTITVTGVSSGSSSITVNFVPTDTTTYSTPESKIYTITTRSGYTITFDANGGEFSDNSSTNTLVYPIDYLTLSSTTVTKYSHTANIDDTGLKLSNYGSNWTEANITGTDRGDTSKAHVVTIPGATSLSIDMYFNGGNFYDDWTSVWEGSHPNYTAPTDYGRGLYYIHPTTYGNRLSGSFSESYTVNGNTLTNMGHEIFIIGGDSVTFGFKSGTYDHGQGYGYYAIITNNGPIESVTYSGTYSEPTKSGYGFIGWLSSKDGKIYSNIDGESLRPDENVTYTAQWGNYADIPTRAYCQTGLSYTGSSQTITQSPGTGYSFSGNTQTNAGSYLVRAVLDAGYVWTDNTTEEKAIRCNISKIEPVITLSETNGSTVVGSSTTFTATVESSINSAGTLTVSSDTTSIVTVSPASTSITATTAGVTTTETISGVSRGNAIITVGFTPTDTTNFKTPKNKTYSIFVGSVSNCVSGDTLADCLVYNDYGNRNYSNAIANINSKPASDFSSASTTYEGFKAIEDYSSVSSTTLDGTSYYYRGVGGDNWVSFAGYLWRVVRINGDGSVRLIYSGTTSDHSGTGTQIGTSAFNNSTNDVKYLGYTYDTDTDSTIKEVIDTWYENNLKESYESYLANGIFCNDKSVSTSEGSSTYYNAYARLFMDANYTELSNASPTLLCTNQADRYTLKESGKSGLIGTNGAGNNKLDYPIGLLTADEISLAGGTTEWIYGSNYDYYLYTGESYWTSSAYSSQSYGTFMFYTRSTLENNSVSGSYGVRPVINLKSNIKYVSGNGIATDPYILEEIPTLTITLSSTDGTVIPGNTTAITATVTSNNASNVAGTLVVKSGNTSIATVSPASTNVTAMQSGVATTINITGGVAGITTLTVFFIPTDSSTYGISSKAYTVTVWPCTSGDTLANCLIYEDYGDRNYSAAVTAIANKSAQDFSTTATKDEGLHATADYSSVSSTTLNGTSYYYRGAVEDNWVSFAGYLWRIVRINGDGSVRLVYSGTTSNHTGTDTQIGTSSFNGTANNPKYVGYTYDTETSSTIKRVIDTWYENNLREDYESYLSNEIFCNDRGDGSVSGSYTYFATRTRLVDNKAPSLLCINQSDRYTLKASGKSKISGTSGAGNNLLDYPIGLLTADEVSLAGGKYNANNYSYYLYTGQYYWLGSPSGLYNSNAYEFYVTSSGYLYNNAVVSTSYGVRPVINLKSSIKYESGKGTESNPYVIQEIPTPTITLSSTEGTVLLGDSTTFIATVSSGNSSSIPGTLVVESENTNVATISPASTNITAIQSGVATTITVTSVASGVSTISLSFIPTDTSTYGVTSKYYTATVSPCLSGETLTSCLVFADSDIRNYGDAIAAIESKSARDFSTTATTDEGLHAISDYSSVSSTTLDGTSYYYRGAVTDNWVSFAGFLWRVVRINGDGSIRMIYSGTTSNHTGTGTHIGTSAYNTTRNNAKYIGYMYDTDTNSTIKGVIDTWYENNLKEGYESYLSNEIFCNDRSGSTSAYGAYTRLNTNKSPSLLCSNQSDRFTLKESGNSSIEGTSGAGNNLLDYPIGLLTADEASIAGGRYGSGSANSSYYLYTGQALWLGSPFRYYSSSAYVLEVYSDGQIANTSVTSSLGVRPVINLRAGVKFAGGRGTDDNPYIVKQEPYIVLSETKGSVSPSDSVTFVAKLYSGTASNVEGTLTVTSSDTSKATVSPTNDTITVAPDGTVVTITVTGVALGNSTITVGFTPTDTSYSSAESKTYRITTRNNFTILFDANGGEFSNSSSTNTLIYPTEYLSISSEVVTKYSHTSNVDDTGLQLSSYGNNWTNANITGTDRGDTSKAHVVPITGSSSLTVDIYYNGQGTSYDWVTVWEGSHPDYTAASNYSSGVTGGTKLGGSQTGNYTVNGNPLTNMGHSTFTISGDTVTFGFTSNGSNVGAGYGYYAMIYNNGPREVITYDGSYSVPVRTGFEFVGWRSSLDGELYKTLDPDYLRPDEDVTYTAIWGHYVSIPTASSHCISGLAYTGDSQTLTSAPATGYTFSGNTQTNAGTHTIVATLDPDYVWTDDTFGTKTFSCSMSKVTPVLSISDTSGSIEMDDTISFTATVTSSVNSIGTLVVSSSDTYVATVSPTSTSITATSVGVSTLETITGIGKGDSTITVSFTPSDTTNFNNVSSKTYSVRVTGPNNCVSGDTLANCLIYNDYGDRNYGYAINAINNKTASDFSSTSTVYEGLKAISDYSNVSSTSLDGTSYYYRGNVFDNWVSFGGFLWRVVRINGDGSVKMIYSGTSANHTGTGTQIGTSAFNSNYYDIKYVGYMYDTNTNSTIKNYIDSWYENDLMGDYESYLSNEIFCNDRSTYEYPGPRFGAYGRLYYTNKTPTLRCVNQSDRFTLKVSGKGTISGVDGAGNNLLDYPIGLLTADEVALAGGMYGTSNSIYYLYTGQVYWTGSPSQYSSFSVGFSGGASIEGSHEGVSYGVRPVINLKSSIKYASGSGLENDPYVIQEIPTPTITLSSTEGISDFGGTSTFTATVASSDSSNVPGTLIVRSENTNVVTVSPTNSSITAAPSGVSTTITVTSGEIGSTKIRVFFIPTDTSTYAVSSRTYTVTVPPCLSGDSFADCLVYADANNRNKSAAITSINNKTAANFSNASTSDEGLHAIADYSSISSTTLDGTSYYYRGSVKDNWVSFAGFLWRIVRINGDGSIRLIYSGTTSNHTGTGTQLGGTFAFNTNVLNTKYVGYMYDTNTNSTIKGVIDTWYENNLKADYEGYLSNEIFCNDRSGTTSAYGAKTRLYTNKAPSLECVNQSDRFTLKESGNSSIPGTSGAGNNLLEYPIGLLTADEVAIAGGKHGTSNTYFYLRTGQAYWLISPYQDNAYLYVVNSDGSLASLQAGNTRGVRPVINLKSGVKYASGFGTESNPYVLQAVQTP
ncbi:InlB B-repeat-containing protein [bacterium]|nr:InlB B-repeat-containing protein [bacterium]